MTDIEAVHYLQCWLDAGAHLVGANTAFDSLVSVITAARRGLDWRRLLGAWIKAYEEGRVHDVFIRQKLLDLAAGCYRFEELPNGKWINHQYNLAGLARRLLGRQLSKPVDQDDTDHWRLRFGELDGVPIADYPREAYDYALDDSVSTAEIFILQEVARWSDRRIARNFPGMDPLANEVWQTMACVPLKAMSAYGLRTDGPAVERLAEEVEAKIVEERAELVAKGLVRPPEYSRNTDAIVAYVRAKGLAQHFEEGTPPAIRLCKANYLASGDPLLAQLAGFTVFSKVLHSDQPLPPSAVRAALDAVEPLVAAGLVDVKHTRDTKAAAKRCFEAYAEDGRVAPRTDSFDEEKHGALVDAAGNLLENYNCVSLDADSCEGSEDAILQLYSSYQSLAKTVSNDLPMLRAGVTMPVHTRFEELLETGRTSSSKPNVQNVRRLPGIRECFVPRPGHVFIDTDFSMLELHTLAQVCMWVLGYSTLGEALNSGKDPHSMIAAKILTIEYVVAIQRKEAGDGELDNARTAGKGLNFGAAGGLSAKTFVVYAWTNYRIRLTLEKAQELLAIYHETWLEIPSYFRWIKSLKDPYSVKLVIDKKTKQPKETCKYNVVQPWSARLRAGATYCAACNSPFQGLGSDVAKVALWLVWKASIGFSELGEADPLFNCHPVNFVHDSIMTEVEEARAHAAALRQKELMEVAGRMVLPTVPVKADMVVTRRWSKKAQQWREPCEVCRRPHKCKCHGATPWKDRKLVPWDLHAAARYALVDFEAKPPEKRHAAVAEIRAGEKWKTFDEVERTARIADASRAPRHELNLEYLKGKQWPSDIARDTVAGLGTERIAA